MPDNTRDCAICGRKWEEGVEMDSAGRGLRIKCPICGAYKLSDSEAIAASFSWDSNLRLPLSCATRQATDGREELSLTAKNVLVYAESHRNTRAQDNVKRLLEIAARRAMRPSGVAWFDLEADFTIIDSFSPSEFAWYINWLKAEKLAFQTGAGQNKAGLTLSLEGWNRVQPAPRSGGIQGRCFVAMWFNPTVQEAFDLGIAPAVRDAGFEPIRIDLKEHNNEITDEIIAEIRNAQFVVADFTGQRAGVYYEAGFAMGLGRPVIWCCRQDEINRLHFDTNHKNHIAWDSAQDLRTRLFRRIRATIIDKG